MSESLPDPDDRHVLAAAIRGAADVIVTYKLGDFPGDALTAHGIEARHPDEFIAHLLDVAPTVVTTAAKHQREGLKNPPRTVDEFLATLEQQGLVRTVAVLRLFEPQRSCPRCRIALHGTRPRYDKRIRIRGRV